MPPSVESNNSDFRTDGTPRIDTPRLLLRMLEPHEADLALNFYLDNKEHLEPTGPRWSTDFFELERWRRQLEIAQSDYRNNLSLKLFIFEKSSEKIVGFVNFSNIVRGVAQYCNVGYALAARSQGQGLMDEALRHAIQYVFEEMNLHRVMANYMPRNVKSAHVLKKLGFVPEGFSRDYLYINGRWEDHILTSFTNDKWQDPG